MPVKRGRMEQMRPNDFRAVRTASVTFLRLPFTLLCVVAPPLLRVQQLVVGVGVVVVVEEEAVLAVVREVGVVVVQAVEEAAVLAVGLVLVGGVVGPPLAPSSVPPSRTS